MQDKLQAHLACYACYLPSWRIRLWQAPEKGTRAMQCWGDFGCCYQGALSTSSAAKLVGAALSVSTGCRML